VRRALRIGAGLGLALAVLTCTDHPTAPLRRGTAAFDLSPLFQLQPGQPPIPVDSVRVQLRRPDNSLAFDSAFAVQPPDDLIVIELAVELRQTTEDFFLSVVAFGGGTTWYDLSATVTLTAGQTAAPQPFTATYVGPGANAARVVMLPADTTAIGGTPVPLRAVVYDAGGKPIPGVPVGYRVSDPTLGSVVYPTPFTAIFTGAVPRRDSAWVIAETPTHLKDSTRVHVVPPAAVLVMVGGNGQTGPVNAALPAPLTVQVLDGLNAGFKGRPVTWSVTAGGGRLSTGTTVSDDTGYASVTLTPTTPGPITVLANAGALSGSPRTFTATGTLAGPVNIQLVSGNGQSDTVRATLAPFVVKVTDALNNPSSGAKVAWARLAGAGIVSADTTTTDGAGLTQITYTLGASLGSEQVRATLAGTSANVLFAATVTAGTGTAVSTTVTPNRDTLTALTQTVTLAAQARNTAGNPVVGAFTWVSRAPAFATVSTTGLVTAVANGATYVVATEAGGTKDSALIVVQQRIATINVTPGTRSIYLTRAFTFSAVAVDGLGSPVTGVTTFTWTSTAPAVASVDAGGNVTALGLGTAQIRATSGAITGVADVIVITPITRIAVVVDTVGAFKTDTFTLTSLGLTRRYRAVAHDTLDAVMSGVSFTWVSTNGSVAVLGSNAGDTTSATSAANGLTQIRATAQGFTSTPGALLTVSQVLASITLSPPASNLTATIAVTGTVGLVARGKDANNRFIAGGSFVFTSANPAVATVDSVSGVVTGVSNGTSDITARSGAITSNTLTVTVAAGGPALISFGRDTVSVGRGSSASIPILLSKPAGTPLTVNLTASAYAHWSAPSIVISPNVTSGNATLVGDSAGTATVTATDGSALGYDGDTAVVKVTANMRLASGSYAINATDVVNTQVLLSDPSPAGGTYVTFNYSTPGIASISPDPALIPAGQLAADIQIRALAAGTTSITPNAVGVNGAASTFTAYAAVLTPSTSLIRLGAGQYEPNVYVSTPTTTNLPVPVTLASSDITVATVTPSVTIPTNSYYAYFTTSARATGSATMTLSAPGWTAASAVTVVSTTPYVGICCGNGGLFTTSPQQNVTVYTEDSVRTAHSRTNSLVVRVSSTDTMVIRMLDSVVTVQPGQFYNNSGRFVMGGLAGSAYIVATASGHEPDSALYTVSGPPLAFSWGAGTPRVGSGQYDNNVYVSVPNNVTAPLVVTLANSDSTVLGSPTTVTIPSGSYYVYFTVRGKTPGSVTMQATAPGYQPTSGVYAVTSPRITACCNTTFNNFSPGGTITVYSTDSVGTGHYRTTPLAVSLVSTDPTVVTIDSSTVTIDSGQYNNSRAHITPVGVGTARIIYSASGHQVLDTLTINVVVPPIQFSFVSALLGRRQHFDPTNNGFYVSTPDNRTTPLAVSITQLHGTVDSLTTTSPTIPAGSYYTYLDAYGLATGADTLIVAAPGYRPDTAFLTVTTPQFTNCCMPSTTTTTNPPIGITVYATDSAGNGHYVMDTIAFAAVSSDPTVVSPAQPFFRIPKNAYYSNTSVNVVGPGTASITYSDSAGTGYRPTTTGTITVIGPSLALSNGTPVLGMRQTGSSGSGSSYVSVPNNVVDTLVVNLLSTDPRVATVPASVKILPGTPYAYFDVTAQDTVGTIQIQATATGYSPAFPMVVQVTRPKFVMSTATQLNTTSPAQGITIYAADVNGQAHYTTEDVTVTLASSAPSVASIDSATITIPAGMYYVSTAKWSPGVTGTAQLSASDARAAYYQYDRGTVNVAVVTPSLTFSWGSQPLGIGQYIDEYVSTPDNAAAPIDVAFSHIGPARTSTDTVGVATTGVRIPQGTYYGNFRIVGTAAGTDTLVATATSPVHNAATAYTVVGQGLIDPIGNWPGSLKVGDSVEVTLYARDPAGNGRYVLAATTFTLQPNAYIEFRSGGASSTVITQVTIPANQYYVQFYVKGLSAGTGSATFTAPNYQPSSIYAVTIQ